MNLNQIAHCKVSNSPFSISCLLVVQVSFFNEFEPPYVAQQPVQPFIRFPDEGKIERSTVNLGSLVYTLSNWNFPVDPFFT